MVHSWPNIYYLSGFTGTSAVLFITLEHSYLLTDFRYMEQAAQEAVQYEIVRVEKNGLPELGKLVRGLSPVGVEGEFISWVKYVQLKEALAGCELLDASEILAEMRQVKEPGEIDKLRRAARISDAAFSRILAKIAPGVREDKIGLELEFMQREMGAGDRSFDYIVASGTRSAMPHGLAGAKPVERGDLLTLDYGIKYERYCSDLTRTVFIGRPESKHREIYGIVLEAQEAAIKAIRPGLSGKEVDEAARNIISQAGYGPNFGHGLGHSLGLEIHEPPAFSPRETKLLEPGMVITVEPGIYIPGWGGVRIEDVVLVTDFGAEVLTQAPKQFIIID